MKKTVLITGASSGIGFELAKLFAKDGYDLVIVSEDAEQLLEAEKTLIQEFRADITPIVMDLSAPSSGLHLYDEIKSRKIEINVLVNNAGFAMYGPLNSQSVEDHQRMAQLNMLTPMELCRQFGSDMAINKNGMILNVSSLGAFLPCRYFSHYYATKAYLWSLSVALNEELKTHDVSVTTLCPGTTRTNFFRKAKISSMRGMHPLFMLEASKVAYAGYKGLMRKKTTVIPGFLNKTWYYLTLLSPDILAMRITNFLHRHY